MPKKQSAERPEDQVRRFEAEVQKLIDAGELNPTEAEFALDQMLRKQVGSSPERAKGSSPLPSCD